MVKRILEECIEHSGFQTRETYNTVWGSVQLFPRRCEKPPCELVAVDYKGCSNHIARSHNGTYPGAAFRLVQAVSVPHHHRLVAVLTVPGAAAAVQVIGRCFLKLQLLLLPNE